MNYNFNEIEARWQKYWAENQTFKAKNPGSIPKGEELPKYYVLDMFPYPSGAGLHVGHPLGYIASDIYARYKRHKGFNVLHPQGYDSFGLPAEQYAIQTGQHPALTTENNIKRYREQLDKIGFSFDWSREVRTSNPDYYKWTQWIFIQLFESWYDYEQDKSRAISELEEIFSAEGNTRVKAACDDEVEDFSAEEWNAFSSEEKQRILLKYRLTYLAETEVNWCPQLGTVLANDEIVNGVSERGGHPVIRKKMTQWSMRISAFAERLLQDLDKIDWTESLKESQRNWIGKSEGAQIKFKIQNSKFKIPVFSTRPDTIFGVTFMTLAPEHELVQKITTPEQKEEVEAYIAASAKKSERERMADVKTISGAFTGAYAEHPFTKEPVPIWIGDYVLAGYGTGAVMSVPCGDQRDYDFARHFDLPITNIFENADISEEAFSGKEGTVIANSDFLSGLEYKEALQRVILELEKTGHGYGKTNYRLRDAVFSRQRYWGEPFPIYYKKGLPHPIPTHCLPLELPEVEKYLPTEEGEPPLGRAEKWHWDEKNEKVVAVEDNEKPPLGVWGLELNTMPGWAGSSWYLFRYMDPHNEETFVSKEAQQYWENVDLYIGGSEHATGHLLYSRFWTKFLHDRGFLSVEEPFKKLINQGMILGTSAFVYRLEGENVLLSKNLVGKNNVQPIHVDVSLVNASDELDIEGFKKWRPEFAEAKFVTEEDGTYKVGREVEKMSKSKYNVVNPDDICENYGADTLRMYEMFLGPLEQAKPWNTAGITGVHNFLKKLWKLYHSGPDGEFLVETSHPSGGIEGGLKTLHKTIKKVTEDIENFSFNTSVSTFMICVNELSAQNCNQKEVLEPLAVLIAPYAPHIAEELWAKLGHSESVVTAAYPVYEEKYLVESTKNYPVSFNGKMRFTMELSLDLSEEEIEKTVLADERTKNYLSGKTPKKMIVVPGKIVNIVI
ncbi:leucine--tRNA ligase [Zunongwangia sp. H14]|uniref:leucine--tRNA ligase n=1 Tax=Zunongwangia sp. H14 TaxID=3240792 RepID=UPI0035627F69